VPQTQPLIASVAGIVVVLLLAACSPSPPPQPAPEPFVALHVVRVGPYPLYEKFGAWIGSRARGLPLAQADDQTIAAIRTALVQNRSNPPEGLWLYSGCIFDVQSTRADQEDGSYLWAYGKVVRCDEPIANGVPEPQMGIKPHALRIFDGRLGYFPMRLLDPYRGAPPPPRT
jgi:hypothetical protein